MGDSGVITRVVLLRHGRTAWNAERRMQGRLDPPLDEAGQAQAAEVAPVVAGLRPVVLVSSDLTRALQTALGIFGDHPSRPLIAVEMGHRERLESSCDRGRPPALLAAEFPMLSLGHLPDTWWHDDGEPDARGLRVEPLEVMLARMADFVEALKARPERHVAVVGHGTFFYHLTGRWFANCEIVPWDGVAAGLAAA